MTERPRGAWANLRCKGFRPFTFPPQQVSGIVEKIVAPENLRRVWKRISAKRSDRPGIDGMTSEMFGCQLEYSISQIRESVLAGEYRPQPLIRFAVPKNGSGERLLHQATVRDRLIQRATLAVLEPILTPRLGPATHSYRRGRSYLTARAAAQAWAAEGRSWALQADILNFFDNLDHQILESKLQALVDDQADAVGLLMSWSKGPIWTGEETVRPERGVAQGLPLSPFLSNLYLVDLDRFFSQAGQSFVRFADDLLLLARERREVEEARAELERRLLGLRLRLNLDKTRVVHLSEGPTFLGAPLVTAGLDGNEPSPPRASLAGSPRALYLCEQGCVLRRNNRRFAVTSGQETILTVSPQKLSYVTAIGNCLVTMQALKHAAHHEIPVFLLTSSGKYIGHLEGPSRGDLEAERRQWVRSLDPDFSLPIARAIIEAKLANSQAMLRYRGLDTIGQHVDAVREIGALRGRCWRASTVAELLGVEGRAAAVYFPALSALMPMGFQFDGRHRRPPTDPANALLSFAYTLLHQNVYALLKAEGLDPRIGFLHVARRDFPALACDLTEEFRAPIADRFVLQFTHSGGVSAAEFQQTATGCWMPPEGRRRFITRFEALMWETPEGGKRTWREIIRHQIRILVEVLLEKRNEYEPFRWSPKCLS